ncbi:acyltransferase family protein [Croceimicrobium sp.]|uniref:acyltransferase family protein n=1 Tax=Croceimicrobium sp. TaxID=2828340 RepID=UPI003BA88CD6
MNYIKGFDGLRCYSILLVVVTHLGIAHQFEEGSYLRDHLFYFFSGPAGVNIFFAISGFLITTLILNEIKTTGNFNVKLFFYRRFLRLLPPIIPFYIALYIFMQLGYVRETTIGLLASIFYLFNFVPRAKISWSPELSHTWSLAVEEQFYIFWAIIFKFFNSYKRSILIFVILFLCVLAFYFLPSIVVHIKGQDYFLEEVFFVDRWVIPAVAPILLGALFAQLNFSNYKQIREKFKGNLPGYFSLLVFLSPLYLPEFLMPWVKIFHGLGSTFLLLWVFNNQERGIIRVLEWAPIKYIGVISYGVYIWQGFFVRTGPNGTPKIWLHDFPYNVVLTFVVAILSYELYEKKVLRLKKRFKSTAAKQA